MSDGESPGVFPASVTPTNHPLVAKFALTNGDIEICASEPVPIGSPPPESDTPSQLVELAAGPSGPQTVWQMTIASGGAYRSYRIPSLYPGVIWAGD